MILSSAPETKQASLMLIESGLTAISIAVAFALPRLAASPFAAIERAFARLASRRKIAVAAVGLATALLRVALLPLIPIPLPTIPDDFSFLLQADTFAHGRMANPTPAMWTHFETIHVSMQPTYGSMYFPSVGLLLAAGKVLLGNPWFAVLLLSALMCAAICWMLQAWLPANWALLGGLIAMLRLGLFSYWVNTYTVAGAIAALGGALVLGALPRLIKKPGLLPGVLLAIGIALLATTRPYEGLLLCIPVALVLGRWILSGKNRPSTARLFQLAALPLLIVIAAGAALAYYDWKAFGNPLTLPYSVNRATYASAPYFVWQSPRRGVTYRHEVLRTFYTDIELAAFNKIHTPSGFIPQTLIKFVRSFEFYAGLALLPPLIMIRRVFRDRRIRFLVQCSLFLAAGMVIQIFLIPHYLAPFTAAFYAIGLQAMRHLRVWTPGDNPVGKTIVRLLVTSCLLLAAIRPFAGPLHLAQPEWPASFWADRWSGPSHFGTERARVQSTLEAAPGAQLAIVRYSGQHQVLDEWVYNGADIDGQKVVWAREMDANNNAELMHYYPGRKVWLVEPDATPAKISPYPMPELQSADAR
jgi:hypothetical protein